VSSLLFENVPFSKQDLNVFFFVILTLNNDHVAEFYGLAQTKMDFSKSKENSLPECLVIYITRLNGMRMFWGCSLRKDCLLYI
jgi:hypothetical protein